MEDLDLCIRLHEKGPAALAGKSRGRVVQVPKFVETSGRRIERLGNARTLAIHLVIGWGWYFGLPPDAMTALCNAMYRNDIR